MKKLFSSLIIILLFIGTVFAEIPVYDENHSGKITDSEFILKPGIYNVNGLPINCKDTVTIKSEDNKLIINNYVVEYNSLSDVNIFTIQEGKIGFLGKAKVNGVNIRDAYQISIQNNKLHGKASTDRTTVEGVNFLQDSIIEYDLSKKEFLIKSGTRIQDLGNSNVKLRTESKILIMDDLVLNGELETVNGVLQIPKQLKVTINEMHILKTDSPFILNLAKDKPATKDVKKNSINFFKNDDIVISASGSDISFAESDTSKKIINIPKLNKKTGEINDAVIEFNFKTNKYSSNKGYIELFPFKHVYNNGEVTTDPNLRNPFESIEFSANGATLKDNGDSIEYGNRIVGVRVGALKQIKIDGKLVDIPKLDKNKMSNGFIFNDIIFPSLQQELANEPSLEKRINFAQKYIIETLKQNGISYSYGGKWYFETPTSPAKGQSSLNGIDCSGFVNAVFKAADPDGIFSHGKENQIKSTNYQDYGTKVLDIKVSSSNHEKIRSVLKPGDIIAMKGHVVMAGSDNNGNLVIRDNGENEYQVDQYLKALKNRQIWIRRHPQLN